MADYMPPDVQSVIGLTDCYLRWKDQNSDPRGFERYHPSAFGKCLRLMQYQRYSERGYIPTPPDPHDAHICRVFGNGHGIHDRWRQYFEDMNILRGYWTCTNPMCGAYEENGEYDGKTTIQTIMANPKEWIKERRSYGRSHLQGVFKPDECVCGWTKFHYDEINVHSDELNFHGHCDMILDFSHPLFDPEKYMPYRTKSFGFNLEDLPKQPIVVDMKSCNHFDFQDVAKGNPHPYYLVQLMIYANILECQYGVLIYENKNTQRTAAFRVEPSERFLWPQVVQQALQMNEMVEVQMPDGSINHLLPPPRPTTPDSKECEWCIYRDICHESDVWSDPDLEQKRKDFYGDLL